MTYHISLSQDGRSHPLLIFSGVAVWAHSQGAWPTVRDCSQNNRQTEDPKKFMDLQAVSFFQHGTDKGFQTKKKYFHSLLKIIDHY